jgi:hypothetical protein
MGSAESKVKRLPDIPDNDDPTAPEETQALVKRQQQNRHSLIISLTIPLFFDPNPYYEKIRESSASVYSAISRHEEPEPYFRFLDLPLELRTMVYEYVLVVGKVFYTPTERDLQTSVRFQDLHRYEAPQVQLLRVCKQVHEEAEPVYLAKNLFVLPHTWPGLEVFGNCESPRLKGIAARFKDSKTRPVFSTAAQSHVRSLSITLDQQLFAETVDEYGVVFWNHPGRRSGPSDKISGATRRRMVHVDVLRHSEVASRLVFGELSHFKKLKYLEIDYTNAFCLMGDCRPIPFYAGWLNNFDPLEIVVMGLQTAEEGPPFEQIVMIRNERGQQKHRLRFRTPSGDFSWDGGIREEWWVQCDRAP